MPILPTNISKISLPKLTIQISNAHSLFTVLRPARCSEGGWWGDRSRARIAGGEICVAETNHEQRNHRLQPPVNY
ncbi:hypothetical protein GUJ93_ZPchr0013g34674 [Zizania palustris]|uniref:Uncharacterized protein n=1 Tax=Zizania palustris TaxID=103762 RepID=A0A8J5WTB3_ZIZPA|nr:hypothetical protein GUJ93_ZPchr0013g34674 [Zizania palustris]